MSKERAKSRIEAEFSDKGSSPDASGSNSEDVYIPGSGLDIDTIFEIDYVNDVLEEGDQYRVYVTTSSDVYISST